eukprot:gnl/TRDRNA2_/TRDRNA2_202271_c0_seq1.p1 gnl/TRDRNA2_/TRDRNA2_202271_c0~~gnl/TRDRNA2_/TRDRNA2_202271_c0_seq1.p1  ORF type:complete len:283 (+),score=48.36 gnl/TRDRNA2_/TRDRNA2_202271_c0_seq1:63-911(+)
MSRRHCIVLLAAFIAHAPANELAKGRGELSVLQHTVVDGTMLGKPSHVAVRSSSRVQARSGATPSERKSPASSSAEALSRRASLLGMMSASSMPFAVVAPAKAEGEGLGEFRKYTALAPLGRADDRIGPEKLRCVGSDGTDSKCMQALAALLEHDVLYGATEKGGYFISGDIRPEIFADDCRFVDPTNDVASLARYKKALEILFDPRKSEISLLQKPVVDGEFINAEIASSGVLKLPWSPRIDPWSSRIRWRVDQSSGLIVEQAQVWNITAGDALLQTFSPR